MHYSAKQFVSVTCVRWPRGLISVSLLLLAACASVPTEPPPASPPPPQQQQNQTQTEGHEEQQQAQDQAASQPSVQQQPSQQQQSGEPSQQSTQQQAAEKVRQQGQAKTLEQPSTGQAQDAQKRMPPDAVDSSAGQPPADAAGAPDAQTQAERGKQLQGEFDRSLGAFDARLSRAHGELEALTEKQAQIDQQRAVHQGSQTASGTGLDDEQSGRIGASSQANPAQRNGSLGDRANLPPAPDDIPNGQNDDIVARQLREAAENESDPEVRKKLWDEYRKYKKSNG